MALFDASRTLSVSGAALPTYGGQSLLTPVRLTGGETIGELFEYVLELKTPDALAFSPSIAANVDLDALIGTEVTVSIQLEGRGISFRALPVVPVWEISAQVCARSPALSVRLRSFAKKADRSSMR